MERLPLFPLQLVLFPGMLLPLNIFEERYKLMIGRCLEEQTSFGVVLIRSGDEVGGPAEPHEMGASAGIVRSRRLEDGRMNLVVRGERRFRIDRLDHSEPYLMGAVTYLESEETDAPEAEEEAQRAAALFAEQFRLVMAITGQWVRRLDLPNDPDRLADFVAHQIEISPATKQELLETLSVPARLRREAELLGDLIRKLSQRWEEERRKKFTGPALN